MNIRFAGSVIRHHIRRSIGCPLPLSDRRLLEYPPSERTFFVRLETRTLSPFINRLGAFALLVVALLAERAALGNTWPFYATATATMVVFVAVWPTKLA